MKRNILCAAAAVVGSVWVGACYDGGRSEAWDRRQALLGPVPFKDRVAYVDAARDRVVVLVADETNPRVETIPIGQRAQAAVPTPDRSTLAVLTRGREAYKEGEVDEAPGLYLVPMTDDATPVRYDIGSPFDRLSIAADGSVAVAYFSTGGVDSDGLFRNPNEIAVVNLRQGFRLPGSGDPLAEGDWAVNPVLRSVRAFGSVPLGVILSPPMAIPDDPTGELRTFAYILAPNFVTMVDANHPERREVTIRLSSDGILTPKELAFAPQTGTAYLRAEGAQDVLEIMLFAEPIMADRDNDYGTTLAELGARGGTPADIAVFDDVDGTRWVLAATPGRNELAVIEADTAQFITVYAGQPIDRILLLPPQAPRVAVLAAVGPRSPRVMLLELDGLGDELVPVQLRPIDLAEPVYEVLGIPGQDQALVVHDDARTVLGVLDVTSGAVSPLEGAGRLDTFDFTTNGSHLIGATRDVPRVGMVEMANLHPWDVRLDVEPYDVFALENGAVFVDHGDPLGLATMLPDAQAGRDRAVMFSGFLIADIFDERF